MSNKMIRKENPVTMWLEFLRNPFSEEVLEMEKTIPELKEAKEILVKVNRSPRDKEMWRVREKDILDGAHAINKAREEGVEKGVAKGIEQGIEKGIKSTAKKLLLVGISVDQISKATGLSTEEIARLKDDQE